MDLDKMLRLMADKKSSDLFITAGLPPSMKVDGVIRQLTSESLSPEKAREIVLGSMNEAQRKEFMLSHECNFAISARGVGRFRVSAFYQQGNIGIVCRRSTTPITACRGFNSASRAAVNFIGSTC